MLSAAAKVYVAIVGFAGVAWLVFGHWVDSADLFGITLLVVLAGAACLGAWAASLRVVSDTDVARPLASDAPAPRLGPPAPAGRSTRPSVFPFLAAAGVGSLALAAAYGSLAAYAGAALLAIAAGGWLGQVVREHPTYTARFGDRVEGRVVGPFGYPVVAVAFAAVLVASVSRLYLAVSEHAAIVVSGLVAVALFGICVIAANGKQVGQRITGALAALAAVGVVSSGIVGAAAGERETHAAAVPDFTELLVEAEGIQYGRGEEKTEELELHEGRVRLTFANYDPPGTYHDIGVYSEKEGGTPYLAAVPIDGGAKQTVDIDTREAGMQRGATYFFRCDFHPAMVGTLKVVEPRPADEGHGDDHGGAGKDEGHK